MVTIIVTVYNTEEYLTECIESILVQDYSALEIILVDDGSTDNSGNICDMYALKDSRITVIHQEQLGVSAARNAGLDSIRKGEYIAFIDGDDYIAPNYISFMLNTMNKHIDADVVLCRFFNCYKQEDGSYLSTPCLSYADKEILTQKEVMIKRFIDPSIYYILVWNKLYKRSLFETLRYPVGRTCEDRWISLELYQQCQKIICTNEPLYYYRTRTNSISHDTSVNWIISQLNYYQHEIQYYSENDANNINYPAKPFISLAYKNKKRLSKDVKSNYNATWKLAIKSLLTSGNFLERLKYIFYTFTYHI